MKNIDKAALLIRIPFLLLIGVSFLMTGGCAKETTGGPGREAVPVMAGEAVTMDIPVVLNEIGRVEAFNTVSITARVGGQIMKVGFSEGEDVKEGDILFLIDPRPFEIALTQAQANLERDKALLAKAESDIARYEELVKKDYITKQEYDYAISSASAAKATVRADSALVSNARLNLEFCTVRAPISGRTGDLHVKEGNLITANSSSPLVTLNRISPVYVTFSIPEQQLSLVRERSKNSQLAVWAFFPTDTTKVFEGKLSFIDNTVDSGTGTIQLKGTFPNIDHALWPNQFVRTELVLGTRTNATVVPSEAVQPSQNGNYIYVIVPGDSVQLRRVAVGESFAGHTIIEEGVEAGEKVVTDGQLLLINGTKVRVRAALAPETPEGANGK